MARPRVGVSTAITSIAAYLDEGTMEKAASTAGYAKPQTILLHIKRAEEATGKIIIKKEKGRRVNKLTREGVKIMQKAGITIKPSWTWLDERIIVDNEINKPYVHQNGRSVVVPPEGKAAARFWVEDWEGEGGEWNPKAVVEYVDDALAKIRPFRLIICPRCGREKGFIEIVADKKVGVRVRCRSCNLTGARAASARLAEIAWRQIGKKHEHRQKRVRKSGVSCH